MENELTKEEEMVIAFVAWSSQISINDITPEIREQLLPMVKQLPEESKRMCSRMGGVLIVLNEAIDEWSIYDDNEIAKREHCISKGLDFINTLPLDEEMHGLYSDFVNATADLFLGNDVTEKFQEHIQLIAAKESN